MSRPATPIASLYEAHSGKLALLLTWEATVPEVQYSEHDYINSLRDRTRLLYRRICFKSTNNEQALTEEPIPL